MKHYLLIIRICFVVIALLFILLHLSALRDIKEGKAYKARCTETTEGTVLYFHKSVGGRHSNTETSISYKFNANGYELTAQHTFYKYISSMDYSEGDRVMIHYNPENPFENYSNNYCYKVEESEHRLSIVGIAWLIYFAVLAVHIVEWKRHPEKYIFY